MNSLLTSLPVMLPVACAWAEKEEAIILDQGIPLNDAQLIDARQAGVAHPEKIRVLLVEALPHPENEEIHFAAKQVGLFQGGSPSLALGYGIFLRYGFWEDRQVLVHECVHVAQYEKLEGIRPFLNVYLRECIDPGYPFGRLEQEAILISREICKTLDTPLVSDSITQVSLSTAHGDG